MIVCARLFVLKTKIPIRIPRFFAKLLTDFNAQTG